MDINDWVNESAIAKALKSVEFFKAAIMDGSKALKGEEMDARFNEIALAHVMAEIIRNDVRVRCGESGDSVDIGFDKSTADNVVKMIASNGESIAEMFHSGTRSSNKNQLVELGATILICCRMMLDKIATDLTSSEDRTALIIAAADLVGETMISMKAELDKPAELSPS